MAAMPGNPLKLIVGLGNPGPEHLMTRHNAGFWFVDALASRLGGHFRSHAKFQGEICRVTLCGSEVTLLKPMTFMNRSGLAIRALTDYTQGGAGRNAGRARRTGSAHRRCAPEAGWRSWRAQWIARHHHAHRAGFLAHAHRYRPSWR